jgi:hypothetical protein
MPWYKGQSYTGFRGVNLKGSTHIRLEGDARGTSGTLTFNSGDNVDRAWQFPAKSGKIPIAGTFMVSLVAMGKATSQDTIVVVNGITAEDGLVVSLQGARTSACILSGATPGSGAITLRFHNLTVADAGTAQPTVAYVAVR